MFYTRLTVICPEEFRDILMAELAETGFDTFLETEPGFEAYTERFAKEDVEQVQQKYAHVQPLLLKFDKIEKQNWNAEWEKNVEPIVVGDQVLVRADFHRIQKKYPYEIVITPKMSFGTGHHPTTHLMLEAQLTLNQRGKAVLDAGCGTGILSIMACLRGAHFVDAFDIDDWSVDNARENAQVNGFSDRIRISKQVLGAFRCETPYDVVLANINKNILLAHRDTLAAVVKPGGVLLLSGFYATDAVDLTEAFRPMGFSVARTLVRDSWAVVEINSKEGGR